MSQHWHGHWIEENYKPTRLGNWEVSNWYPQWPVRHCRKTTFQCDNKGHLLAHLKKINRGREHFKTAWELPKKIDRRVAQELSAPPEYKKRVWEAHKAIHRASCGIGDSSRKEIKSEKVVIRRPLTHKEIKSEPFKPPKPKPEAKATLKRNSPVLDLKTESKDSDSKSNSTELNSELKILESDTNTESHCTEEKINNIVCLLHQTCKI